MRSTFRDATFAGVVVASMFALSTPFDTAIAGQPESDGCDFSVASIEHADRLRAAVKLGLWTVQPCIAAAC